MDYVDVPLDITRIKVKFLFGLTKRQVICFGMIFCFDALEKKRQMMI